MVTMLLQNVNFPLLPEYVSYLNVRVYTLFSVTYIAIYLNIYLLHKYLYIIEN